jgi:hypothetical protein
MEIEIGNIERCHFQFRFYEFLLVFDFGWMRGVEIIAVIKL